MIEINRKSENFGFKILSKFKLIKSAGINTTTLPESMNNLIEFWINTKRKASLTQLFKIIEEINRIVIINNDIKNRNILETLWKNKINNIILNYFKDETSKYIFFNILNKYFLGLDYIIEDISLTISRVYFPNFVSKEKIITFKNIYYCTCNFSIHSGISCRHIFAFIIKKSIISPHVYPLKKDGLLKNKLITNQIG